MIAEKEWRERQDQWDAYAAWARLEVLPQRAPELVLADLGAALDWLPASVRAEDRDPERAGVRRMHELLALTQVR